MNYTIFQKNCKGYNGDMNDFAYWRKQGKDGLFPEIDTFPPEQKRFAGKILIIGGNKGVFFAVASAMSEANKMGVGEARAVLPKSLRGTVPSTPDVFFAEVDASGAFGRPSLNEMLMQADWADAVLIVGDLGRNAETSIVLAEFMERCEKPVFLTRDAVDVLTADAVNWSMRDDETTVLLTMPQLQKMLRAMYYPKVITLSMPMNQLIETLHKFTISYEMTVVTFHNGQLVLARNGEVVTEELADTPWNPITLWSGALLARAAVLRLWNAGSGVEKSVATAFNLKID